MPPGSPASANITAASSSSVGGTRPADPQSPGWEPPRPSPMSRSPGSRSASAPSASSELQPAAAGFRREPGSTIDRAAVLGGVLGSDPGTAARGRLDDDDEVGQRGDDAIADREPLASGLHAVAVLTDDESLLANFGVERAVPAGIHDVETGRDDPDDESARVERADVRGGVDPDGQAAHDGDTGAGEEPAQLACVFEAVRCRGTRPDDRHPLCRERVGPFAFAEENRRPVGERVADRIVVVVGDPNVRAACGELIAQFA